MYQRFQGGRRYPSLGWEEGQGGIGEPERSQPRHRAHTWTENPSPSKGEIGKEQSRVENEAKVF